MTRIHIERLIIDGVHVPEHERPRLQESIREELGRLVAERGLPGLQSGASPVTQGPPLRAGGKLAANIAHSIYGGLKR